MSWPFPWADCEERKTRRPSYKNSKIFRKSLPYPWHKGTPEWMSVGGPFEEKKRINKVLTSRPTWPMRALWTPSNYNFWRAAAFQGPKVKKIHWWKSY